MSSLALTSLAPSLEAAAAAGHDRCCRRGVCCHHRKPADTTCLRGLCPCGGHDEGSPAQPVRFDAVMPDVDGPDTTPKAGPRLLSRLAVFQSIDLSPPHAPPRPSCCS